MSAIAPLSPQRAARIATQLVELIDLQRLNPGDRLPPERQLADLLEVSRPSLREALHILQAQGLVQIKHGQGTFVQEPIVAQELRASMMATTHDLNELFDAREVLEVPASKWAADKATKEDIRLLRATLNQIETVTATTPIDFDQLQLLDAKFHLTIAAGCNENVDGDDTQTSRQIRCFKVRAQCNFGSYRIWKRRVSCKTDIAAHNRCSRCCPC